VRTDPGGKAIVLMYHRVDREECDPWGLCVDPDRFAEQVDVLRGKAEVLSVGELTNRLKNDTVPSRSACITFDDGYVDNVRKARPVLERFDVPATFFLVSGQVGQPVEFWWDDLERLLLQPGSLPDHLSSPPGFCRFGTPASLRPRIR
jgi:peptidoglycan/xylan/chitin deacetylase (PgdA/CDA1 family)